MSARMISAAGAFTVLVLLSAVSLCAQAPVAAQTREASRLALIRSDSARRAGDLEGSSRALRGALAADSTFADLWIELGVTESFRRRWTASDSAFRRAIALEPGRPVARLGLARAQAWQGNYVDAKTGFLALTNDPASAAEAYDGLGFISAAQLDPQRARRWYENALRLRPGDREATEAIAHLDAEARGEYTGLIERSANPGGSNTTQGRVRAVYGLNRNFRFSGGVAWGVNPEDVQPIPINGTTAATPQTTALTLGYDQPITNRLRGGLNLESLFSSGGAGARTGTYLGGELSYEALPQWWINGGVRHGNLSDGSSTVGFIGAATRIGRNSIAAQLFRGWAEHADASSAVTVTWVYETLGASRFRLAGAWGLDVTPNFRRFDGDWIYMLNGNTGVNVGYADFDGGYRRGTARLGAVVRY